VTSRCTRAEVCLYTVTPDFGFLVDSLPSAPHVVVASACSGHGFKHAPATGEAAAALALGLPESVDLTPFGFDRLDLVAGAAGETA
jgi:sarcosine oxidase